MPDFYVFVKLPHIGYTCVEADNRTAWTDFIRYFHSEMERENMYLDDALIQFNFVHNDQWEDEVGCYDCDDECAVSDQTICKKY